MKRDMDLARQILFKIEASPTVDDVIEVHVDGHTDDEVAYHVLLLHEAGLVAGTSVATFGDSSGFFVQRLTWQGHEFVEAARDNLTWGRVRDVMEQSGGFVFEVAKQILVQFAATSVNSVLRGGA